jgi:hypothetical protein
MTLIDHLRLVWPSRTLVARGPTIDDVTFDDGLPPPTAEELAATESLAQALFAAESAAVPGDTLVSLASLKIALGQQVFDEITAFLPTIQDPDFKFRATVWWTGGGNVRRDHPVVEQFRLALNKTQSQVDAWFSAAVALDNM